MPERRIGQLPDGDWLERLQAGDFVWLCKENQWATVEFPFEPPRPGYFSGKLVFRRIHDRISQPPEVWHVRGNGTGFDGLQLMLPAAGWIPAEPQAEQITPEVMRVISSLRQRVAALERRMGMYRDNDILESHVPGSLILRMLDATFPVARDP